MTIPGNDPYPSEPVPAKASAWEDIIDIFYAPSDVFARRERDPKFGVAMVVQTLLMAALFYAMVEIFSHVFDAMTDAALRKAMQDNPQMTEQMAQQGRSFARYSQLFGQVIGWPLLILMVGAVLWLVGKLFDSQASFKQALMVTTFAQFPRVIGLILSILLGLVTDTTAVKTMYGISLSPARLLPETTNPFVLTFLMRLDPFLIWTTVLLGIGLAIVGKIPRQRAMMAAFIVWLLGVIPQLSQARQMADMQAGP